MFDKIMPGSSLGVALHPVQFKVSTLKGIGMYQAI